MDLVEIRKKAKSRKKKDPDKASGTGKKDTEGGGKMKAPPSPSGEPEPETGNGAVRDSSGQDREGSPPPPEGPGEGIRQENGPAVEGFSSLRSVLMSQQEEEEAVEEEQLRLLTFMLGHEEYALNIMDVKEIIRPREVTEVPKAPDFILGILSLRGTIIPVLDVNKRLGLAGRENAPQNRIVVVKWQDHLFGLLVDSVVQVMSIPLAQIEPPPEIFGGVEGEFLGGVGKMDDRLIILLNMGRILAAEEDDDMSEQVRLPPEGGR